VADAPKTAVVIPSWNSLALLPRCLDSLEQQQLELEILVVDNGSDDGTLDYLQREGVPLMSLPQNVGFARAVNLGAAQVQAPFIFALNADTVLEPGAVQALVEALEAEQALGGVQPRILQLTEEGMDSATARLYSAGQALTRDGRAIELGAGEAQSPRYLAAGEIFGVCGAACLLRRELFDQLGGYDERYFSFYEDVDLNLRGQIAGWRFSYVPEAVVWHVGNAAWMAQAPRPTAWNARLVARNRLATQLKFLPASAWPRVAVVELGALARAASERRFFATLRGKLEALGWLPAMLRERRRLGTEGELSRARRWLGSTEEGA
jgi:GT2 family glycosyltransferase